MPHPDADEAALDLVVEAADAESEAAGTSPGRSPRGGRSGGGSARTRRRGESHEDTNSGAEVPPPNQSGGVPDDQGGIPVTSSLDSTAAMSILAESFRREDEAAEAARAAQARADADAEFVARRFAQRAGLTIVEAPAAPAAPAPVAGTAVDGTGTAAPVAAPTTPGATPAPTAPVLSTHVPPAAPSAVPPATDPTATVPTVTSDLVEGMDYDHTAEPYRVSADGVGRPWKAFAATHGGQEYIVVCFNGSDKTVGVLKAKWDINRTPAVDRARELADADAPARKPLVDRLLGKRTTTK